MVNLPGSTPPSRFLPRVGAALALTAMLGIIALLLATSARAEFSPAKLVSGSGLFLAETAGEPAISENGRYVAFSASIAGVAGVYRKDLSTGAVVFVAAGGAPSISANGRYIAFTTSAGLVPEDTNGDSDVYVADMEPSPPSPRPSFTIASAADHSSQPLGSSSAEGRDALSANGRVVAFVQSSAGPAEVEVRNLQTDTTTLVSVTRDPASGQPTGQPVEEGGKGGVYGNTAALSADGTTVAWQGMSVAQQVPTLPEEPVGPGDEYVEPLWRRIADGPLAPTRRVTGGGDPSAPGCDNGVFITVPACDGPFNTKFAPALYCQERGQALCRGVFTSPQLSADGRFVAIESQLPPLGAEERLYASYASNDAYVVDMASGLTRRAALRQLTVSAFTNLEAQSGMIGALAISPDGQRVAFVTGRTIFPLSPPAFVGQPPPTASRGDVYEVNLQADTIERVTLPYDGGGSNGTAASISFSADGHTLAFASTASNLAFGDVPNGDARGISEVFVSSEVAGPAPVPASQSSSLLPPPPPLAPIWQLSVTAHASRDGSALLDISLPGAGRVRAEAHASLPSSSTSARVKHHRSESHLVSRRVGTGSMVSRSAGVVELRLAPLKRYRSFVTARAGLYSTIKVSFRGAPGTRALSQSVVISFHAVPTSHSSRKAHRKATR